MKAITTNQMTTKKFQRKIEDFQCGNCGKFVTGNGYTNHCPYCLWSRHVDINPGDRSSDCGGMMDPIDSEIKSGIYYVHQRCQKCGLVKRYRLSQDDNFQILVDLSNSGNKRFDKSL